MRVSIVFLTILVICCVLFTGAAAGYTIAFTVDPAETVPGGIETITGTSDIPAGYTDEAILYREVPNFLPKEAGRYPFVITEGGYWGFSIDTTGFLPATYKVQLSKSVDYPYGSSAVLMHTFTVTAPPETPTSAAPANIPSPSAVATPDEVATLAIPLAPTTSPAGVETVVVAAGISALAFVYASGRRNE